MEIEGGVYQLRYSYTAKDGSVTVDYNEVFVSDLDDLNRELKNGIKNLTTDDIIEVRTSYKKRLVSETFYGD